MFAYFSGMKKNRSYIERALSIFEVRAWKNIMSWLDMILRVKLMNRGVPFEKVIIGTSRV